MAFFPLLYKSSANYGCWKSFSRLNMSYCDIASWATYEHEYSYYSKLTSKFHHFYWSELFFVRKLLYIFKCLSVCLSVCPSVRPSEMFRDKPDFLSWCLRSRSIGQDFLDQGKNLKLQIFSYFHNSDSPISSTCRGSKPAGQSLNLN